MKSGTRFFIVKIAEELKQHFLNLEDSVTGCCDQIGRFLEILGNKFYCKSGPNILKTIRAFEKHGLK